MEFPTTRMAYGRHVVIHWLTVLLLGAAASDPLSAQCIPPPGQQATEPCEDSSPPNISITPAGGTYDQATRSITFEWEDESYTGQPTVTLNGTSVRSSFTVTSSSIASFHGQGIGTVLLQPGTNTFAVGVCDNRGQCATQTAAYTYGPPGVAVTPDGGTATVAAGTTATHAFTVQNTGPLAAVYNLSVACTSTAAPSPFAGTCTRSPVTASIAPGAVATVTVSFPVGRRGAGGTDSSSAELCCDRCRLGARCGTGERNSGYARGEHRG